MKHIGADDRKRILLVTDSMGLPRGGVDYDETWPALLRQTIGDRHDCVTRQQRGMLSRHLVNEPSMDEYRPSLVVLQLGITECAPRPLGPGQRALVDSVRPQQLRRLMIKGVAVNYARLARSSRALETAEGFGDNLAVFAAAAARVGASIIFVTIAPVAGPAVFKNPRIVEAVARYNASALQRTASFNWFPCTVSEILDPAIHYLDDGYHWNAAGHAAIGGRILQLAQTSLQ